MGERARILVVVGLSAAMFLVMPGRREFAASHEARVGQTAREMADAGWPWSAGRVEVERVHLVRRLGVTRLAPEPDAPPMHVNPWVVPLLSGEVRLQKPPLPYWCAAVLFRLMGVSEAACRLIPCLLGALATLLLYDLAKLLYSPRIAWMAALVFATTFPVIEDYRLAMADPYLAFFTMLCVWAWVRAGASRWRWRGAATQARLGANADAGMRAGGPGETLTTGAISPALVQSSPMPRAERSAAPDRPRAAFAFSFILLFYVSLALGAVAKGPLILLQVFIPVAFVHLCFGRRPPGGWLSHLMGALIFLAIALPWPMAVMRAVPNARELWQYESVGELSGENQEGLRAWWYYLMSLPFLAMPWAGAWVVSVLYPAWRGMSRHRRNPSRSAGDEVVGGFRVVELQTAGGGKSVDGRTAARAVEPRSSERPNETAARFKRHAVSRRWWRTIFPLAWFGAIVLVFSLVGQKKYPYLLPSMPALALMIAVALAPTLRLARRWRMRHWPGAVIVVQVAIGIGASVAVAVFAGGDWADRAAAWVVSAIALALALLAGGQMLRVRPTRWFVAQAMAYALILLVYYNFVETAMNNDRSPKALARELRPLADGDHVALLLGHFPEEVAFYLPLHPREGPAPSDYLVVVDDGKGARARAKHARPSSVPQPTREDFQGWFPDARVTRVTRVPMKSAPGDARYKVYELTVARSGLARR